MKASEARYTSGQVKTNSDSAQYDKVIATILAAAKKGEYRAYFYESLRPTVKKYLIEDGYSITDNSTSKEGDLFVIRWDEQEAQ